VFFFHGGGRGKSPNLSETQYAFLPCSFAHALSWLRTTVGVLPYQGRVAPDDGSGGSLDSLHRLWISSVDPGPFLPAFGTKQHLLRAALLASLVNPD